MTAVTFPTLQELFGEPFQRGVVDVRPWAGTSEIVGDPGVPGAVRVLFEAGTLVSEIDRPASTGAFCYRWVVTAYPDKRETILRYTSLPTSGPVAFTALVDVDPTSFAPVENPASILDTARTELLDDTTLQRITQAAYDDLATPDPDVLYVITES